jgi:Zn-dependent protease
VGQLDLGMIVITFVAFLFSTACHEAAHAWMANRWGDPTGKEGGQLTLNPIPHIRREPIGMVVMPLLGLFAGGWLMGWGSTPVTPSRMRDVKWGNFWTSAAGPLTNMFLAITFVLLLKLAASPVGYSLGSLREGVLAFLWMGIRLNIILMVLNFLPIPPLDGGSMLESLLPYNAAQLFQQIRPFGFMILLAIMLTGIFGRIVSPIIYFAESFL